MRPVVLISLIFWGGIAAAQFVELPAQEEYEIRRQYLKQRVADYYMRLNYLDDEDSARKQAEIESKKERLQRAEEFEKARREHRKNRKPRTPTEDRAFMEEIRQRTRDREQHRKDYVQRRRELKRLTRSLETIPENEELGIDLDYDADYNQ